MWKNFTMDVFGYLYTTFSFEMQIIWNKHNRIKVALYTKGSTFYELTSKHGILNILWKCLYWLTFLYIIIAQWSQALVLWTADPEFRSSKDFC